MTEGRLLVKLKLPRKIIAGENLASTSSMVDLTSYLKPCLGKARRTMRQQIWPTPVLASTGVSSSDHNHSPQVLSSQASVHPDHHLGSPRCSRSEEEELGPSDDSGKFLKRRLEETEDGPGRGDKSQKTDSGMDYPRISDTELGADHDGETGESEIKINNIPDGISSSMKPSSSEPTDIKKQVTSLVRETVAPAAPDPPRIYACSFCHKTFLSHTALGGHISSHKKLNMIIYNASDYRRKKQSMITNSGDQQTGNIAWRGEINAASPESVGDDRTHTCKICFKKFSSGQALGGHQRHHWTGNLLSAPRILDFDLNEVPKEEDEDPSSKC